MVNIRGEAVLRQQGYTDADINLLRTRAESAGVDRIEVVRDELSRQQGGGRHRIVVIKGNREAPQIGGMLGLRTTRKGPQHYLIAKEEVFGMDAQRTLTREQAIKEGLLKPGEGTPGGPGGPPLKPEAQLAGPKETETVFNDLSEESIKRDIKTAEKELRDVKDYEGALQMSRNILGMSGVAIDAQGRVTASPEMMRNPTIREEIATYTGYLKDYDREVKEYNQFLIESDIASRAEAFNERETSKKALEKLFLQMRRQGVTEAHYMGKTYIYSDIMGETYEFDPTMASKINVNNAERLLSPMTQDVKKTFTQEQLGIDITLTTVFDEEKGVYVPAFQISRERKEAAAATHKSMLAFVGLASSAAIGALGAYPAISAAGVGGGVGYGVSLAGGTVGSMLFPEVAEEPIKVAAEFIRPALFPNETKAEREAIIEEKFELAKPALGIAGFVIGSKAAGFAYQQAAPVVEKAVFKKFGIDVKPYFEGPFTITQKGQEFVTKLQPGGKIAYEVRGPPGKALKFAKIWYGPRASVKTTFAFTGIADKPVFTKTDEYFGVKGFQTKQAEQSYGFMRTIPRSKAVEYYDLSSGLRREYSYPAGIEVPPDIAQNLRQFQYEQTVMGRLVSDFADPRKVIQTGSPVITDYAYSAYYRPDYLGKLSLEEYSLGYTGVFKGYSIIDILPRGYSNTYLASWERRITKSTIDYTAVLRQDTSGLIGKQQVTGYGPIAGDIFLEKPIGMIKEIGLRDATVTFSFSDFENASKLFGKRYGTDQLTSLSKSFASSTDIVAQQTEKQLILSAAQISSGNKVIEAVVAKAAEEAGAKALPKAAQYYSYTVSPLVTLTAPPSTETRATQKLVTDVQKSLGVSTQAVQRYSSPTKIKVAKQITVAPTREQTRTFEKFSGFALPTFKTTEQALEKTQTPIRDILKITAPTAPAEVRAVEKLMLDYVPAITTQVLQRYGVLTKPVTRTTYRPPPPIELPVPDVPPPPPPSVRLPPLPKGKRITRRQGLLEGYEVFVKRAGKFAKVSQKALTKKAALGLGAKIVDISPAATFQIKKAGVKVKPSNVAKGLGWDALKGRFYKKGPTQFVERRRFRISSPRELAGITQKGLKKLYTFPLLRKKKTKRRKKKTRR
jgi:hypothetical protein